VDAKKKLRTILLTVIHSVIGGFVAIHNFDGTNKDVYSSMDKIPDYRSDADRLQSPLSAHQDKIDIALAERQSEEAINVSGGWTIIYKRVRHGGYDEVWEEEADPMYESGKKFKGLFKPQPITSDLTKWGIDNPSKVVIIYSRAVIFKNFGDRLIKIGDIIQTPQNSLIYKDMRRLRVTNVAETGMYMYRWLYLTVSAEFITGDISLNIKHK
jgi:hypothetical protein